HPLPATALLAVVLGLFSASAGGQQAGITPLNCTAALRDATNSGLSITPGADGASLRCMFQRMEGRVSSQGLWLTSTAEPSNRVPFRVVAQSVGRGHGAPMPLAGVGEVQADTQTARFHRAGLDEEYTVSVDGVRQDFVVTSRPLAAEALAGRPAENEALRVELKVIGARAEASLDGARLILSGSGRTLAYSRLKTTDARGRPLTARMEVVSPGQLAIVVEDAAAVYPVRIDTTFSDANWIIMNPGIPGADGPVNAAAVDGSGNLYIGGLFTIVGGVIANDIAKWDGSSWSALGSGMNGSVVALAVSGSNVYAGGYFSTAGGSAASSIAKWDGSSWTALGSGANGPVVALAVSGNTLYAGGYFGTMGGKVSPYIA
ncbi:MAG: hypothetical protein ACREIC_02085, partial [Limisphaerales bacterium]